MVSKEKIKAFSILLVCMLLASFNFWLTSRYPDLGTKAALGGSAPMSGLGFFPLYEIRPDAPIWEKLFYGTINWMETNRRGMTFAFILGAFMLSLLPLLSVRRLKGGFKNGFLGLLMGTPLGLCVNCSSPVARSMQISGMSLEASLALLISSPTMNIVVLTMAFAMFPLPIVLLKLFFVLIFVLLIIPLACRYLFKMEVIKNDEYVAKNDEKNCDVIVIPPVWVGAIRWSLVTYIKNFIQIIVMTGPLMVLAGFLGTVMITFMPWTQMAFMTGDLSSGVVLLLMAGVAFIGALLPVPMAFDVAMSAAFLQAGMPLPYVAVFLFTLGTFSIYAFFIVWQSISLRMASFLLLVTVALGLMMGGSASVYENIALSSAQANVQATMVAPEEEYMDPIIPRNDPQTDFASLKVELDKNTSVFEAVGKDVVSSKPDDLSVSWSPFVKANQTHAGATKGFTRIYGDDLGILQPYRISYLNGVYDLPRTTTSIATGDVHNDGWEDVLLMGDSEVKPNLILYANIGGKRFVRQALPAAEDVILVALQDMNGDGWLDIVYATYKGKNFVIYNDKGEFKDENRKPLGADLPGTTNSMGFGDLNKDGKLEVFLGNWSAGPNFLNYSKSKNVLLTRTGDVYSGKVLDGFSGETLASLFWDFNRDGNLDVYIGNDYMLSYISNLILLGDGKGALNLPDLAFVKTFYGGQSTMSMDVGDIDNDLKPEFFIGHLAYIGQFMRSMSKIADRQIPFSEFCTKEGVAPKKMEECQKEMKFKLAIARISNFIVDACDGLENDTQRNMCRIHLINYMDQCGPKGFKKPLDKDAILKFSPRYADFCERQREAWTESKTTELSPEIRERHLEAANESSTNILLYDEGDKAKYKDIATVRGVGYGGWTWNAKFADLDNDGWQDLYVTNGYTMPMALGTKMFYRNKGDGFFEDATKTFGLEDYSVTAAYSYVDYDHDGDLDIVSVPLDWPVKIFRNDKGSALPAIQVELEDKASQNSHAIGAKIIIHYTSDGKPAQQIRIIKGSGGYKSFDAPVAHFGLGKAGAVQKIEIEWPDGKKETLDGEFKAGGRYKIIRS